MTILHVDLWTHNILLDNNAFKENIFILFRRSIAELSVPFFLHSTTNVLNQLCMVPIKKILSKILFKKESFLLVSRFEI